MIIAFLLHEFYFFLSSATHDKFTQREISGVIIATNMCLKAAFMYFSE